MPKLARSPAWSEIKARKSVVAKIGDVHVEVDLAEQPTKIGKLRFLICPGCGRRVRDLFMRRGAGPACKKCLKILHPDQKLGGSKVDKMIVIPSRQIKRIERRLEKGGMDRNARRKLQRRRKKILANLQTALAERRRKIGGMAEVGGRDKTPCGPAPAHGQGHARRGGEGAAGHLQLVSTRDPGVGV